MYLINYRLLMKYIILLFFVNQLYKLKPALNLNLIANFCLYFTHDFLDRISAFHY